MAQHLIPTSALHRWVTDLWLAAGSEHREAILTADHLVGANLAGHDSHGVGMVPRYVNSWLADELQLNRHAHVMQDSGSMLTLDGQRGMGQAVTHEAMELAIARAREHGVCVMGLRHSHHLGRVGHWAEQAVAAGMVSVHFVNAVSKPIVAPHGGKQGRFLTNPFTVGIPVPGREPVLLDFATSAIALGKVRVAYNSKSRVPPGSLLDHEGSFTDDPGVMFPPPGSAPGALVPFAGHKGYALAMVCELLGAALIGGDTTRPPNAQMKHAIWNNMLTIVFDPQRMGATEVFGSEFSAFVEWVQSAPLQEGSPGVLLPGDPERATRKARAQAVPIDSGTLAQMDEAAAAVERAKGNSPGPLSRLEIAAHRGNMER
ncbi:malate/lactate/ureidoglycolate dehydrogenase [Noviherbaspirillum massiliense]|uniref:malate/lactate/ureidoglycolate dehydrogenase n=1 Tax=Noviherbaspirillum massiliense TaxID=1465823 RepID=UPI0002EB4642|nr:malate/lactate/ureidoglycolate dehydrogenase [Noviherbaspirillum massiliense]